MWENHFSNSVPQRSDFTCLDNVIHQPQDRDAEHNCCKELMHPALSCCFSNQEGGSRAASPSPPWQRTPQEGMSHSYWEATPTSTTHMGASAQTLTTEQKHEGRALQRGSLVLHSLWTPKTWQLQLGMLGITEQVYWENLQKGLELEDQHFPVFVPNTCFSTVQSMFFLLSVQKKKKKNKLTFVEQILAFVHIKGQEKGTKAPCNRKRTYLYL